ncbi:non-classical arabinogalactan protein 31-like [Solanum dulcamara]|uniref:non-classical arabinogalactan protein 31-like n=1 Tax=Solanum dulcamara TaxID=45834 RepID=UPI0024865B11|nr:non-classical arabinogalactan protein 31-like [Solanum dulcamara]
MAKALVLFQLSVLLLSSFTVVSHAHGEWYSLYKNVDHLSPAQAPKPHKGHHHPINSPAPSPIYTPTKPPTKAPTKPPTKAPAYSPSKPPVKPPVKPPTPSPYYPTRKPVAVRGLVYCKPCKFRGIETLYQAKPLQGAKVKLVCSNTKKTLVEQGETDKNGFFWILPKLLSSGAYHKCKVFLVSSKNSYCNVPTNFNGGKSGALLKYTPLPKPPAPASLLPVKASTPIFDVFTVGPFGFEPSKKVPCKK